MGGRVHTKASLRRQQQGIRAVAQQQENASSPCLHPQPTCCCLPRGVGEGPGVLSGWAQTRRPRPRGRGERQPPCCRSHVSPRRASMSPHLGTLLAPSPDPPPPSPAPNHRQVAPQGGWHCQIFFFSSQDPLAVFPWKAQLLQLSCYLHVAPLPGRKRGAPHTPLAGSTGKHP